MTRPFPPPPPTPASPYVLYRTDDYLGNELKVTVEFGADFVVTKATGDRDPACVFKTLLFGLGTDGTPDTTAVKLSNLPSGHGIAIPVAALNALGFRTVQDMMKVQITAV